MALKPLVCLALLIGLASAVQEKPELKWDCIAEGRTCDLNGQDCTRNETQWKICTKVCRTQMTWSACQGKDCLIPDVLLCAKLCGKPECGPSVACAPEFAKISSLGCKYCQANKDYPRWCSVDQMLDFPEPPTTIQTPPTETTKPPTPDTTKRLQPPTTKPRPPPTKQPPVPPQTTPQPLDSSSSYAIYIYSGGAVLLAGVVIAGAIYFSLRANRKPRVRLIRPGSRRAPVKSLTSRSKIKSKRSATFKSLVRREGVHPKIVYITRT